MKKRILLLIIMLLLLCGCSAEVNIEVNPSKIDETISITTLEDNYYTKEEISSGFRNYLPVYSSVELPDTEPDEKVGGVQYYEHTKEELEKGYKNSYNYSFSFNKYKEARSVNSSFRSVMFQNSSKDKTMLLSTDAGGLKVFNDYPGLESVKVNIKTDYEVLENNADSVNDNVYTWYFSKDTKKGIYLLMKNTRDIVKEKKSSSELFKNSEKDNTFMDRHPIITGLLGILGIFILAFIVSKIKIKG